MKHALIIDLNARLACFAALACFCLLICTGMIYAASP